MSNLYILERINSRDDLLQLNDQERTQLCQEIREFLIANVSKTGGHLAGNLGAVELTMALHMVLDLPKDKIIWDVGHQSYTHKILTGRKDGFITLRQYGGMSGFPKCNESESDCFNTGHSSTSISAGLGMAAARELNGEDYHVISVIGDGALTGGMAFEALNNAGRANSKMIVILNDNEMSISENVGSFARSLTKMRNKPRYHKFKNIIKEHIQWKSQIFKLAEADLKKTYNGAALGWAWAVIKPTITIFIYWFLTFLIREYK